MPASAALTLRSRLDAPPADVWRAITDLRSVDEERGPWLSQAAPFGYDRLTDSLAGWSDPLFTTTVWAGGVVPVDQASFHLDVFEDRRRLVSHGRSLWFRSFRHERVLEARDGRVELVDRVLFEPSLPGLGTVLLPLVAALYEARHRVLRARHGSPEPAPPRADRTLGAGAEQETALVAGGILGIFLAGLTAALLLRRRDRGED
jgi:hypothetical protein